MAANEPSARAPRYRWRRRLRVFADKRDGWTILTPSGEGLRLGNAASAAIGEALATGATEAEILERLARMFQDPPRGRLRRDLRGFLAELEDAGLVAAEPDGEESARACNPPVESDPRTC
jgi:hypothetical protein